MRKPLLPLLALVLTGCASSPSPGPGALTVPAQARPSEAHCQQVGEMMENVARMREYDVQKSALLEKLDAMPDNSAEEKASKQVALDVMNYALTTQLPAARARTVGYNKCMAGFFGR